MKNTLRFVTPFIALSMLTACGATPEERFERAQASFAASDFTTARLDLISALKEKPSDVAMLKMLVDTQLALGDGEGALAALDDLGGTGEAPANYAELRGEAEVLRGQFSDALAVVDGVNTPAAYRVRGLAHIGLQKPDLARAAFMDGIAIAPADPALRTSLARFNLAVGELGEARKNVDLALGADPDMRDAMFASAQVYAKSNKLAEALAAYEAGLKRHPGDLGMMLGKVGVLGDMGRVEEAAGLLAQAKEQAPDSPGVVFLLARTAIEQEDWAEARAILQPREAFVRDNPPMQIMYGQALLRLGQIEQARSWLSPLVKKFPGNRNARQYLAEAQLASGDPTGALKTLNIIVQRPDATPQELTVAAEAARQAGDPAAGGYAARAKLPAPEWVGSELAKADAALQAGRWKDAAAAYENISQRSRNPNAMVLNNYAYAAGQMGETKKALELALQALKLDPKNPSIMDTAGWLLVSTGSDKDRGVKLLREAAKLDPDNPAIARHLAQAT